MLRTNFTSFGTEKSEKNLETMTADKLNGASVLLNIWKDLFKVNIFGIKSCAAAVFSFAINRLLFIHGEQVARLDLLSLLWTDVTAITGTMWDEVIHQKARFHINAVCFYYCLPHCRLTQCAHVNFNLSHWKLQPNQRCCLECSSFTFAELGACSVSCADSHTRGVTWHVELR